MLHDNIGDYKGHPTAIGNSQTTIATATGAIILPATDDDEKAMNILQYDMRHGYVKDIKDETINIPANFTDVPHENNLLNDEIFGLFRSALDSYKDGYKNIVFSQNNENNIDSKTNIDDEPDYSWRCNFCSAELTQLYSKCLYCHSDDYDNWIYIGKDEDPRYEKELKHTEYSQRQRSLNSASNTAITTIHSAESINKTVLNEDESESHRIKYNKKYEHVYGPLLSISPDVLTKLLF
jgi:hypothetical protein